MQHGLSVLQPPARTSRREARSSLRGQGRESQFVGESALGPPQSPFTCYSHEFNLTRELCGAPVCLASGGLLAVGGVCCHCWWAAG